MINNAGRGNPSVEAETRTPVSSHVYLLIEAEAGSARTIADACRSTPMPGAKIDRVSVVTGPYDVILRAEIDDITVLSTLLDAGLRSLPGVRSTVTCIELEG